MLVNFEKKSKIFIVAEYLGLISGDKVYCLKAVKMWNKHQEGQESAESTIGRETKSCKFKNLVNNTQVVCTCPKVFVVSNNHPRIRPYSSSEQWSFAAPSSVGSTEVGDHPGMRFAVSFLHRLKSPLASEKNHWSNDAEFVRRMLTLQWENLCAESDETLMWDLPPIVWSPSIQTSSEVIVFITGFNQVSLVVTCGSVKD